MKKNKFKFFMTVFFMMMITFFFMTGIWAIDIGVSGAIGGGIVTGLFGIRDPIVQYHIGLMISGLSFLFMGILLIANFMFVEEI